MPYIPMTNAEKCVLVKNRLKNMDIHTEPNATWLDMQIVCHTHGLDVTEMLRPQIPDQMMIDTGVDNPITIKADKPKKVSTSTKKPMGFSAPEQSADDDYQL